MGGMGFFRLGVWQNFMRARRGGHQGNMIGEGFILGGVFVIGAGDQVSQSNLKVNPALRKCMHFFVDLVMVNCRACLCVTGDYSRTP